MTSCPACELVNALDARFCHGCGSPLVMRCSHCATINARTRTDCHHCGAALVVPDASLLHTTAPKPEPRPIPLLLHGLDDDPVEEGWKLSLRADPWPELPALDPDLLLDTTPLPWIADPDAPRHEPPPPAPTQPAQADRSVVKAQRRAAVRRSQLRRRPPGPADSAAALRDVLVLEPDATSRADICAVLEAFGFRPHMAISAAEAEGVSQRQPHVAALLGLGDDADAAADLCRLLHDIPRQRPLALIAIGERSQHADRVRMHLAGADLMLFRPVGRGDLARALESCGLRLPQDPRNGSPPTV